MRYLSTMSRGAAAVCAAGLLSLGFAATASAQSEPQPPTGNEANQPENWVPYIEAFGYTGVECTDDIDDFEGVSWTTDADYVLVVLKNATYNDEFWEVPADETLETEVHDGKQHDISHIIACTADMEDEPGTETPKPTPTKPGEPTGPVVETDVVESSSPAPAVLGGAAALAGLGLAGAMLRRKGQH